VEPEGRHVDVKGMGRTGSLVEGEPGHQQTSSPVIFVVPTTTNYLSYLGRFIFNKWIQVPPYLPTGTTVIKYPLVPF
jgi:hypothetical protein